MSISAKLRPNLLFLRSIPLRPDKIAAVVVAYPQACSRHTRYTLGHAAGGGGLLMLGAFRCAALQDCEATGAWIRGRRGGCFAWRLCFIYVCATRKWRARRGGGWFAWRRRGQGAAARPGLSARMGRDDTMRLALAAYI